LIQTEHKKWARLIFNPFIRHLLKSNFNSLYLVNDFPEIKKSTGLIITPNHFSWWDGFIIDFISRKFTHRKVHIMMLEEQLKKYWFFKKVGAYSINLSNPRSIAKTIQYSREILRSPENFLVIYPQGEIQSIHTETLIVKEGLKKIIEKSESEIYILPTAIKFEYGDKKNPDIVARFGHLIKADAVVKDFSFFRNEFRLNVKTLKDFTDFTTCRNILK